MGEHCCGLNELDRLAYSTRTKYELKQSVEAPRQGGLYWTQVVSSTGHCYHPPTARMKTPDRCFWKKPYVRTPRIIERSELTPFKAQTFLVVLTHGHEKFWHDVHYGCASLYTESSSLKDVSTFQLWTRN